jgi:primosomal protein N''
LMQPIKRKYEGTLEDTKRIKLEDNEVTKDSTKSLYETLEEALNLLEARKAKCIQDITKKQKILTDLEDQIQNLKLNSDTIETDTGSTLMENMFAILPQDVLLYILEFYDLPYYQPFYSHNKDDRCRFFYGYFREDASRTIYLLFSCVSMINYNTPSQGCSQRVILSQHVPINVRSIDVADNEFILFKGIEMYKSLTTVDLSYSCVTGPEVINILDNALTLKRLNISHPLSNSSTLDYTNFIVKKMTSLTALSCIGFGKFKSKQLAYALKTLPQLCELRISVALDNKPCNSEPLKSHPNLKILHLYGDNNSAQELRLPSSLTELKLNTFTLNNSSSVALVQDSHIRSLNLSKSKLSSSARQALADNTSLTKLALTGDDSICPILASHKYIRQLIFKQTYIDRKVMFNTILDHRKSLLCNLIKLQLTHIRFDEKCALRCTYATNLTSLTLKDSDIFSGAARIMRKSMPIKELVLRQCNNVNDDVVCCLLQHPLLEHLNLGLAGISDAVVPFIILNNKLKRLIMYAHLSAKSISRIIAQNRTLTALSINGSPVEPSHLASLDKNTKLTEIHLAISNDVWGSLLATHPYITCAGAMKQ